MITKPYLKHIIKICAISVELYDTNFEFLIISAA